MGAKETTRETVREEPAQETTTTKETTTTGPAAVTDPNDAANHGEDGAKVSE